MKFSRYYREVYLPLHKNEVNRLLHLMGTTLSLALIIHGILTLNLIVVGLGVLTPYPPAWIGHLYFEKNKPAAWSNPIYARLADWRMCADLIRGKI